VKTVPMIARTQIPRIAWLGLLFLGLPAPGATYSYQDDFETDALLTDSWRHSPLVDTLPAVYLTGLLAYEPGLPGRGLGFFRGFDPGTDAYLAYAVVPPGGIITKGAVSFLLQAGGSIDLFGSSNGTNWSLLGEMSVAPGMGWRSNSLPVSAGAPSQYLELRGNGVIDQLRISATYFVTNVPVITQGQLLSNAFILRGRDGVAHWNYEVWRTTNVALPQSQWTPVATNAFDSAGYFDCTNPVQPGARQSYFRVVMTGPP
jgi:hypothetical protein